MLLFMWRVFSAHVWLAGSCATLDKVILIEKCTTEMEMPVGMTAAYPRSC